MQDQFAVSHLSALHLFALFSNQPWIGDTTSLRNRLIVPRHPLSPHRRKAKRWGAKTFRIRDHLRCPIFLPLTFSCPAQSPTLRSVIRRYCSLESCFRDVYQTPVNWRTGRYRGQKDIQNKEPICGVHLSAPFMLLPFLVTNLGLGDTTSLRNRLIVPRHILSPNRRKAKNGGQKHSECETICGVPFSCPLHIPAQFNK